MVSTEFFLIGLTHLMSLNLSFVPLHVAIKRIAVFSRLSMCIISISRERLNRAPKSLGNLCEELQLLSNVENSMTVKFHHERRFRMLFPSCKEWSSGGPNFEK